MAEDRTRIVQAIIRAKNESAAVLGQFKSSLLGLTAVAAAVAGAMYGLQKAVRAAVAAASEQEDADVKLAQALSTVGQNTQEVRDDLDAFVKGLQDSTKFTDIEVQGVLSLLTSLGRLSGEGLKRATLATLDFATVTVQDATSAARLVAKAALGSAQAFTRYGLVIEEGATASEKFAAVLKFLEGRQGAAEASGKTFSAQMQNVEEQFGELLEATGKVIIQDEGFRAAIARMTVAIKGFGDEAEKGGGPVVFVAKAIGVLGWAFFQTAAAAAKVGSFIAALVVQIARILPWIDASNTKGLIQGFKEFSSGVDKANSELTAIVAEMLAFSGQAPTVASTIGTTSKGFKDLGDGAGEAKTALEELGLKTFPELKDQAGFVQQAFADIQQALGKGLITPEFFAQVALELEAMAKALEEAGIAVSIPLESAKVTFISMEDALRILIERGFGGLDEAIRQSNLQIQTLGSTLQTTLAGAGVGGALALGDTLVDAAFGAKVSFKEFFKQLLADLAKAIIRALILRAVLAIATQGQSEVAGGGASAGFLAHTGQHGGEVRGGIPGLDSVRALLQPGEIILPTSLHDDFLAIAAFAREMRSGTTATAESQGHPAFQAQFQITPRRDDREAADLIDDINRLVERRGYRLVATHVVS